MRKFNEYDKCFATGTFIIRHRAISICRQSSRLFYVYIDFDVISRDRSAIEVYISRRAVIPDAKQIARKQKQIKMHKQTLKGRCLAREHFRRPFYPSSLHISPFRRGRKFVGSSKTRSSNFSQSGKAAAGYRVILRETFAEDLRNELGTVAMNASLSLPFLSSLFRSLPLIYVSSYRVKIFIPPPVENYVPNEILSRSPIFILRGIGTFYRRLPTPLFESNGYFATRRWDISRGKGATSLSYAGQELRHHACVFA